MKKIYQFFLLSITLCIVMIGQIQAQTIPVIEDTFIRSNRPDENNGANADARAKLHADWERTAFLKFDISSVTSPINEAVLHLNARTIKTDPDSVIVAVYKHDDNWNEATTTAGTYMGTIGDLIATFESKEHTSDYNHSFTVDISAYAEEVRTGDGILSLAFKLQKVNNANGFRIASKENDDSSLAPRIEIDATTSTEEAFKEGELSLSPNPVNDLLNIGSESGDLINSINILTLEGKTVLSLEKINARRVEVNTNTLSSGTYFIQVYNDEGAFSARKFIKH